MNKELRDHLFGGNSRNSVIFEVEGKKFELLELTLNDAKALEGKNEIDSLIHIALSNVVVPETKDLVFEKTDRNLLLNMGTGHSFFKGLNKAMKELMPGEEDEKKL